MSDRELARLRQVVRRARELDAERDQLIRQLMPRVTARETTLADLIAATGLSKQRLYQIRDAS